MGPKLDNPLPDRSTEATNGGERYGRGRGARSKAKRGDCAIADAVVPFRVIY